MSVALEEVEQVFRRGATGQTVNKLRQRVRVPSGALQVMQAAVPEVGMMGLKAYTVTKRGARFVVMLFDVQTGALDALIEADRSSARASRRSVARSTSEAEMRNALVVLAIGALAGVADAGGSNYGVTPGALPSVAGKITEYPVPTPRFARDPAAAPDGTIWIAVMHGDKLAHFNPATKQFREYDLPHGANPHGALVDRGGQVWYTGNGNGTIGRLDPASGKVTEYRVPSGGDPHTLVIDDAGTIWFTVQGGNRIGRLEPATGRMTEYRVRGQPYGLTLDRAGYVWFCEFGGNRLGKLDPKTGRVTEIEMEPGSAPRRMATAPDGTIWVTLYSSGKLLRLDPDTGRRKEYSLPAGPGAAPYAVTVDGAGRVWVNEFTANTVLRFDPASERFETFKLPTDNTGIRKMVVDARGRLWYMGSHSGKLGVIE